MAKRVKAHKGNDIVLELDWEDGTVTYRGKRLTMDVEDELSDASKRIDEVNENPDARPLDNISAVVEQLDIVLERDPALAADGKPTKPSEVILPLYEGGKMEGPTIRKMVSDVIAATRPT